MEKNYSEMFAQKRSAMNTEEQNRQNAYDAECSELEAKTLEYVDKIREMYEIAKSAEDNDFRFPIRDAEWCSHITIIPFEPTTDRRILRATTDGIDHRLGFYDDRYNILPKFGYKGGGCNNGDVHLNVYNRTWDYTDHYSERKRFLKDFLRDIDIYIETFYKSIDKFLNK